MGSSRNWPPVRKKGNPIPAKFDPPEEELIAGLHKRTGLSQSEILRRAVRLLGREIERHAGSLAFIIEELGPKAPPDEPDAQPGLHVAEEPTPPKDKNKRIGFVDKRNGPKVLFVPPNQWGDKGSEVYLAEG